MPVKGIPYWGRTTERLLDLGCFDFSKNDDFENFRVASGVWEGVQTIDASRGIQIDGFSARTEPYGSNFNDFFMIWVFLIVLSAF